MNSLALTVIILLSILTVAGCKSRKGDTPDTVIIEKDVPSEEDTVTGKVPEPYIANNESHSRSVDLCGVYKNVNDGSTLKIAQAEGGKYDISLNLFRLTNIDDGIGKLNDSELFFAGTDASGNPISGTVTITGDSARLVFTNSTWEYLPVGTTYTFEREQDLTQR